MGTVPIQHVNERQNREKLPTLKRGIKDKNPGARPVKYL